MSSSAIHLSNQNKCNLKKQARNTGFLHSITVIYIHIFMLSTDTGATDMIYIVYMFIEAVNHLFQQGVYN